VGAFRLAAAAGKGLIVADDLSDVYGRTGGDRISAISPSSMASSPGRICNTVEQTFTAPGSSPVDPLPAENLRGDPTISATDYTSPVVIGADGAKVTPDNATRTDPFSESDGGGWMRQPAKTWGPS